MEGSWEGRVVVSKETSHSHPPPNFLSAVVEAIAAINSAAASGDQGATMTALQTPAAGIRSLTEECAQAYTEKLAAARQEKVDSAGGECRVYGAEYGGSGRTTDSILISP